MGIINPIGSYVAKHKLGCVFFFLANIRPQFRSTLKAINLIAVGKTVNIKAYGLDNFLLPFVEELKVLYCDGIVINMHGFNHTFFGGLLAFLADNLAAHAVGGFKESMSFSLRICRSCMITTQQAQIFFDESKCSLRDPESHLDHCQLICGPLSGHNSTSYGINRLSILESVLGFSVTTSIPHDIMHDLFEGVVPYELKHLILHCVEQKFFSITLLNRHLCQFDFEEDKPTLIDENLLKIDGAKLRQSASQMIALSQCFPLLVGDLVPYDDDYWSSFLLLLRICQIALSPVCTHDTIMYLRVIIEEKLAMFKKLYPRSTIIPKFHYMVHYASQIQKFGPLVHSWTMRQEAKLSFFKRISKKSNYKNICKTVAKKHQLWQCYAFLDKSSIFHINADFSPKYTLS